MDIVSQEKKVKVLLEKNPRLRDNDMRLLSYIWEREAQNAMLSPSMQNYIALFGEGKLTKAESITRARRRVQEFNVHLRGNNYKGRQEEQEHVKEQLGYGHQMSF